MRLTERQMRILEAMVNEYVRTGAPVGSKVLSQIVDIGVSPATIRSEMAILYDKGFLEQPHTSAGRIPSHQGIREYVDYIMKIKPLSKKEISQIDSLFNQRNPDPDKLLGDVADALSDYTGYATVASSIVADGVNIDRLEFIVAGQNTVVIVLIASNGIVRSKVVRVDFVISTDVIEFFGKFANDRFSGKSIDSITTSYINAVGLSLGEYSRIFTSLILAVFELCQEVSVGKYYVSGSTKLLSYYGELSQLAKELLAMIESPENLHKLFGTNFVDYKLLIGKENSAVELTDSSVIVTQYMVGGQPAGTIGLIGPVSLDYRRVIPHLEYFSATLGKILSETFSGYD